MKTLRLLFTFALLLPIALHAQNSSLSFDGDDDYVEINDSLSFQFLESLSYSFWANSQWVGNNYVADITDNPADYNNAGFRTFIGTFGGGGGATNFNFSQYMNGENTNLAFPITFKSNDWAHVACVVEKVSERGNSMFYELRAYVNGVIQASDTLEVQGPTRADRLLTLGAGGAKVLGARFNLLNFRYLDGLMDDFSMHAFALTETQIRSIVCTGVTPNNANTILFYNFNAGSGFTSADQTGNGFDGTNQGPLFNNSTFPDQNNLTPVADFDANTTSQSVFATFENLSVNYDVAFWTWGDGTFDTTSNAFIGHTFPSGGTYNVCIDAITACGNSDQFCDDVDLECDAPVASISIIGNDLVVAVSANDDAIDSVLWDFGDGETSSSFTIFHTYNTNGVYQICLYVYNNCGFDTSCVEFNAVLQNVSELEYGGFSIFPNPVQENIHIEVADEPGLFDVSIFDLSGKLVFKQINNREKTLDIRRPELPLGEYILQVSRDNKKRHQKLLLN